MPGGIEGHDLIAPAQRLAGRTPGPARLREPMDQGQPFPGAGHLDVQHAQMVP